MHAKERRVDVKFPNFAHGKLNVIPQGKEKSRGLGEGSRCGNGVDLFISTRKKREIPALGWQNGKVCEEEKRETRK